MKIFILSCCVILLNGCAALGIKRSVAPEDLTNMNHLGVVSLMGNQFNGIYIGAFAFNNRNFQATVPEWNIDNSAEDIAINILEKNNKLTISKIPHDELDSNLTYPEKIKKIFAIAKQEHIDTLVVLEPSVSENNRFFKPGYGLYSQYKMNSNSNSCIYAAYIVNVYKVASQQSIGWEWGTTWMWGGNTWPCGAPEQNLTFKYTFDEYSSKEKEVIRSDLQNRFVDSLSYALTKLNLAHVEGAVK